MSSFNKVIIAGNLTRDPEFKQLGSGQSICKLGLASNRQYKNRQTGATVQEVCYVDIDVWGAQAETCNKYLQKGKPVLVEGRLKLDTWKDNEGQNRSKHSIVADRVVFLGSGAPVEADSAMQSDDSGLDKDILDRLNEIKKSKEQDSEKVVAASSSKSRKKKAESAAEAEDSADYNEVEFKDEPPFADDLPF